jgi:hypothetical protein
MNTAKLGNPYWDAVSALCATGAMPDKEVKALKQTFGWACPEPEILNKMVAFTRYYTTGKLVQVGAGNGYWANQLCQWLNVLAFDPRPLTGEGGVNSYYGSDAKPWFPVSVGDHSVASQHADCVLFLCWPPGAIAELALSAYTGNHIIYIGEDRGGCCARDPFFDALENLWVVECEAVLTIGSSVNFYSRSRRQQK